MSDLNAEVKEEWREDTTTFQRVKSVVSNAYDGQTAAEISERALVSETTARSKLEELVDDGFVEKTQESATGAALYRRSWESLVFEQAQDIVEHTDSDALLEKVAEMQSRIDEYRDETGVDSPEDIAWNDSDIDQELLLDWRTTRRNLSFAKVALALDQAGDVVDNRAKV